MKNTINEEKKWKVLSSEYLVKRPWLTARRDVAELPDGRIIYHRWEYVDKAAGNANAQVETTFIRNP